ncbi:hypothetical protein HZ326_18903 [Fusarium oxysporum f. sp. albedinis]|nr:Uncharacterized protein HZ326_26122 [Fusarium oxysporum f. sp. albedinis]KAJ0138155.1 hypothetical protein HZ326_18903 [Fusarium oxysporum f. sp. albedinis]
MTVGGSSDTDDEVFQEDVKAWTLIDSHDLRSNETFLYFVVKCTIHRGREATEAAPEVDLLFGDREIQHSRQNRRLVTPVKFSNLRKETWVKAKVRGMWVAADGTSNDRYDPPLLPT